MTYSIGIDWGFAGDTTRIVVLKKDKEKTTLEHHENVCLPQRPTIERAAEVVRIYPDAPVNCDDGGHAKMATEHLRTLLPERRIDGTVPTSLYKADLKVQAERAGLPVNHAWDDAVCLALDCMPREYDEKVRRT